MLVLLNSMYRRPPFDVNKLRKRTPDIREGRAGIIIKVTDRIFRENNDNNNIYAGIKLITARQES